MADRESNVTNAYQDELSFTLTQGATTIEVNATAGSPGIPFYLVIDADDDDLREVVFVDNSKDDDTFTLTAPSQRGVDGTVDIEHQAGALVGVYPVAGLWTDINDRVDATQSDVALHEHDGVDSAQVPIANVSGHDASAHDDLRVVGEVIFHAGTSVPSGFLECDGQEVSRTTFNDLFTAIGTTWGPGDGSTTFNVPDLRDAVPVGRSGSRALGSNGGSETHAHGNPSTGNAGGHTHTQGDSGSAGSHAHGNPSTHNAGGHTHNNSLTSSGGGHSHSTPNMTLEGNHNHGNAGGHNHGNSGGHNHSNPSTGSGGSHNHGGSTAGSPSATVTVDTDGPNVDVGNAFHDHPISSGGSHNHGVGNTGSVGGHNHGSAGSHNHGSVSGHRHTMGSTGSGGSHQHNVVATGIGGVHDHAQADTASGGSHDHSNPTTNSSGNHAHSQGDTGESSSYPPFGALMALIRF